MTTTRKSLRDDILSRISDENENALAVLRAQAQPDSDIGLLLRSTQLSDPLDALTAATALHNRLEDLVDAAVIQARHTGSTWQQIGAALDVTRQYVHAKYGKWDEVIGYASRK